MFKTVITRALLVSAATVILSGCFVSVNPLISGNNIVYPLAAGSYAYYSSSDQATPEYVADIKIHSDGYFSSSTEFDHDGAVMRDMGNDLYIVQEPETAGDNVQYGLVKIEGDTADVWEPMCSDLSDSDRADLNISKEDDGDCAFTSYPQLREALLIYYENNKSSPAGKFVRQSSSQQQTPPSSSKDRDGRGGGN